MKQILPLTLLFATILSASCSKNDDSTTAVSSVTLSPATLILEVGETGTLSASITPTDAANKAVTWSSNDTSVASVSDAGLVTALKKGTATITVTSVDNNTKQATCALTVNAPTAVAGNFFYSDKTYSSTFDSTKNCIGIVFWVDPTDATKGKIVSLDQTADPIHWSTETITTNINNETDGAVNTRNMLALGTYTPEKYPSFAWCIAKNTPATAGISWYLPANQELRQLLAALHGLKWIASGTAAAGEIVDWGNKKIMPESYLNPAAREVFNSYLTTAKGTAFDFTGDSSCWSSTESGSIEGYRIGLQFGATNSLKKDYAKYHVRAISVF